MTTIRDLLLARASSEDPALLWAEGALSWAEYVVQAASLAEAVEARLDPARPPHVAVLMENGPAFALHLAAAGLGGHVIVGLNNTRRGTALAADAAKADCQFVVADAAHLLLAKDAGMPIVAFDDLGLDAAASRSARPAKVEVTPRADSLFMLIFTSGTSGDPKAVRITHEKVSYPGWYLADKVGLSASDVCYVSMPMFHSNAVMAGWAPALATGAAFAVAPFSARAFLGDVRRFGATYANYVGKPLAYVLATPELPDDADNPLRVLFGNEASERDVREFERRFSCRVIDGFGSTENAVVVTRVPGTPPNALGKGLEGVAILDPETLEPCPPATFDEHGTITNLDACTGELVNTLGTGQFAGYYNDEAATAERMRGGMYWSGDLAYADAEGWIYYAGRTSDWLRVDGENLAAAPIERILQRHPAVSQAAVYAVPDPASGDQLAVALVLTAPLSAEEFENFLSAQGDLSPKAWPSYVRLLDELPRTATNKVLKRDLRAQGVADATWTRAARARTFAG